MKPRYAAALLTLLSLAMIPTIIHSYIGVVTDDGLRAQDIPVTLAGFAAAGDRRDETWGRRRFDSDNWIARRYASGADALVLTVARSYDLKALYHHPELAVAYDTPFDTAAIDRLPGRPEVPVHVLRSASGALGLYVLHYDGSFIEDPIWFQLRTAGELLFAGRKPMTLLFVQDAREARQAPVDQTGAARLLLASIDAFLGS